MDSKLFKKNLATIKKGEKRFSLIHDCAVFALEQINKHSQTTPANELISTLHKADRVEALKTWFIDFGKVVTQKDETLKYKGDKKISIDGKVVDVSYAVEFAAATPYYEYTKEIKPASSYDVIKGINAILARSKKMAENGGSIEHAELLEKLKALIPAK